MKLIICEKPSLAKNVRAAISRQESFTTYEYRKSGNTASFVKANFSKTNGKNTLIFFQSQSFIVCYAFGHLFNCGEPEKYLADGANGWTLTSLPIIPDHFRFYPTDDSCKQQFMMINALINRSDVTEIINCGDADREGEIIVRNILRISGTTKPVTRLWLPEQTEETILKNLSSLPSDSIYDNLANAGYARTFIDWLFGYNLSRYIMLKINAKGNWGTGRVIIPIVHAVYLREQEINNFVSKPYYQISGKINRFGFSLMVQDKLKFDERPSAEERLSQLKDRCFAVKDVQTKKTTITPPKLFSLDSLQGKLSQDFEMTLEQSMPIIQKLYDNKYITYPRTDTEYLAENEQNDVFRLVDKINDNYKYNLEHITEKRVFDNTKVESHSAIHITSVFPTSLSECEKNVYDTVFNRFCAVFAPPCTVNRTTVQISDNSTTYTLKGDVPLTDGFRRYEAPKSSKAVDSSDNNEQPLPPFFPYEHIPIDFIIEEKTTKAPPRYTIKSLNDYLKAPFKSLADTTENSDDTEEYANIKKGMEIGTVATRTAIITKIVNSYKYISIKKGKYYCEPKGNALIHYLLDLKIDLFRDKNVDFNMMIKQVEKGKLSIDAAISRTSDELVKIINQDVTVSSAESFSTSNTNVIGKCPFCTSDIIEGDKSFFCSGYKQGCQFKLWKNCYGCFSFIKDGKPVNYTKSIKLTKSNAKSLLKCKETTVSVDEKNGKGKYKMKIEFSSDGKNKLISQGRLQNKK